MADSPTSPSSCLLTTTLDASRRPDRTTAAVCTCRHERSRTGCGASGLVVIARGPAALQQPQLSSPLARPSFLLTVLAARRPLSSQDFVHRPPRLVPRLLTPDLAPADLPRPPGARSAPRPVQRAPARPLHVVRALRDDRPGRRPCQVGARRRRARERRGQADDRRAAVLQQVLGLQAGSRCVAPLRPGQLSPRLDAQRPPSRTLVADHKRRPLLALSPPLQGVQEMRAPNGPPCACPSLTCAALAAAPYASASPC